MADPHAQSVIGTRIDNFRNDLYTDLTEQEKYCYEQSTDAPLEDFQPKFQELNDAFESWMDLDRKANFRDFINGLYAFLSLNKVRALGEDQLETDSDADKIFDADGLIETILTEDQTYFDDVVCYLNDGTTPATCDPEDDTQVREFPTLDAAISTVSGADENPQLASLVQSYVAVISGHQHDILFDDPQSAGGLLPNFNEPYSKAEIRAKIFEDFNYLPIYQEFNIGLELPLYYQQ